MVSSDFSTQFIENPLSLSDAAIEAKSFAFATFFCAISPAMTAPELIGSSVAERTTQIDFERAFFSISYPPVLL